MKKKDHIILYNNGAEFCGENRRVRVFDYEGGGAMIYLIKTTDSKIRDQLRAGEIFCCKSEITAKAGVYVQETVVPISDKTLLALYATLHEYLKMKNPKP